MPVTWKIRRYYGGRGYKVLDREIVSQFANNTEKLMATARYALSYEETFEKLQYALETRLDEERLHDTFKEVRRDMIALTMDTGTAMCLLGGVWQQIK